MSFILPTISFIMYVIILSSCEDIKAVNDTGMVNNSSELKKDMYVIHAMVYQVGIITNNTGNDTGNLNSTGIEEAFTFFNTNGSKMDLSKIPRPILTNVTAESLVGLAPSSSFGKMNESDKIMNRYIRSADGTENSYSTNNLMSNNTMKGNLLNTANKWNSDSDGNTPVKIVKGSAVIPKAVGIQALSIPALFSNNLTNIPVPIPNTSVVQYAKVNTLVHMP